MPPAPSQTTPARAFLDVRIGDQAVHAEDEAAYRRAQEFADSQSSVLGTAPGTSLAGLEDWQRDMLTESYASDPSWSAKGPMRLEPVSQPRGGRLVFSLNAKACPKTTANFAQLCTGEKGLSKSAKKPLHYAMTPVHRIISDYIAQGGDITRGDGSGGDSVYGGTFNDEKEGMKTGLVCKGALAMANSGKNSNSSQWFVVLTDDPAKLKKMDGKYVVFGNLVEGLEILDALSNVGTENGTLLEPVIVWDSGTLA
ncbi:hypothetical protein HKX48_000270 [Thoreauomyces humboldtii]|nr:hypothetical protein HKX48_000270 [Thoreauomyces humboldtii]